jgi:hypothetical protein
LYQLEDGWLDGEGIAPKKDLIELVNRVINQLVGMNMPEPKLFPTVVGGINIDWEFSSGRYLFSLEDDYEFRIARSSEQIDDYPLPEYAGDKIVIIVKIIAGEIAKIQL